MIPLEHPEVKDVAALAQGDFCFITLHTKTGKPIKWRYFYELKDYGGVYDSI